MRDPSRTLAGWVGPGYVAAHVLLDLASFVQPVVKLGITPWNPQAGLMLAFLYRYPRAWGWVVVALFAAEFVVRRPEMWEWRIPVQVAAVAAIYAVAARAVRELTRKGTLLQPRVLFYFVAIAAVTALLAGVAVVGTYAMRYILDSQFASSALSRYWVGDLNGILMVTPLVLALPGTRHVLDLVRGEALALGIAISAVAIAFLVVFIAGNPEDLRFFYLFFVPVVGAALRWEAVGAVSMAVVVQIALVIGVQSLPSAAPLVDLQYLMLTLTLTGLALGSVVSMREEAVRLANGAEQQQRAILMAVPDAVVALEQDHRLRPLNTAAMRLLGDDDSLASRRDVIDVFPELPFSTDSGSAVTRARPARGGEFPAEIAWARQSGVDGGRTIIVARDITLREQTSHALRQRDAALARASRAAVAGELATALAHELSQPMTALVTYLRAAQRLLPAADVADARLHPTLEKAADQALRASTILHRLRDFYGGRAGTTEIVKMPDLIGEALSTADRSASGVAVGVAVFLDPDLPKVLADRLQFEIVLLNLLANAKDALRGHPTPRIELSVTSTNAHVCVRIDDNGPGVPDEVAGRVFEPFVTSKPDGMGMGLAVSRSLLRALGGDLRIGQGRLGGACFDILLPRAPSGETR